MARKTSSRPESKDKKRDPQFPDVPSPDRARVTILPDGTNVYHAAGEEPKVKETDNG